MSESPEIKRSLPTERIQKLMARAGYGSRREIERWIAAGHITVDGKVATPGDRISSESEVTLRGKAISLKAVGQIQVRVLLYHKPAGELVSRSDPDGRKLVFDQLPDMKTSRWVSVGRLDYNTSGLLLFTNDGQLANKLMHPSSEIEREYAVRILGKVTDEHIKNMRKGVMLEDGPAKFDDIVEEKGGTGANHWYHVLLKEGRNREVRRIWESQDLKVSRLNRVRYGPVVLPRGLRPGKWKELDSRNVNWLYQAAKLSTPELYVTQKAKKEKNVWKRRK
ncbi:MAG TPA: 23S rRNA pseudouridylate synthase B [Gammaproteobacteria bacterium]|nr:23S rRNA pseudouridylate synthase B [Gammaproteobacteria bacterium]